MGESSQEAWGPLGDCGALDSVSRPGASVFSYVKEGKLYSMT